MRTRQRKAAVNLAKGIAHDGSRLKRQAMVRFEPALFAKIREVALATNTSFSGTVERLCASALTSPEVAPIVPAPQANPTGDTIGHPQEVCREAGIEEATPRSKAP